MHCFRVLMELQPSNVLTFSLCVKITLRTNIWNNETPMGGWETKTGECPEVREQLVWLMHRGVGEEEQRDPVTSKVED